MVISLYQVGFIQNIDVNVKAFIVEAIFEEELNDPIAGGR